MNNKKLSFADINILREDIAEVIVHEGIEMDLAMVDEYHAYLQKHLQSPFSLLVNKKNAYTYSFEAQAKLATIDEINVMAIVTYNSSARLSTANLQKIFHQDEWNLKFFRNCEDAYDWLIEEQNELSKEPSLLRDR